MSLQAKAEINISEREKKISFQRLSDYKTWFPDSVKIPIIKLQFFQIEPCATEKHCFSFKLCFGFLENTLVQGKDKS